MKYLYYLFYNYVISFIDKIASATLNNQKKKLKYNNSLIPLKFQL